MLQADVIIRLSKAQIPVPSLHVFGSAMMEHLQKHDEHHVGALLTPLA